MDETGGFRTPFFKGSLNPPFNGGGGRSSKGSFSESADGGIRRGLIILRGASLLLRNIFIPGMRYLQDEEDIPAAATPKEFYRPTPLFLLGF